MAELTSILADFAKFVLITDAPIVGSVREEAVCEPSTGVTFRFFGFSVISFGVAFVVSLILIKPTSARRCRPRFSLVGSLAIVILSPDLIFETFLYLSE